MKWMMTLIVGVLLAVPAWAEWSGPSVLSGRDVQLYKALFAKARKGQMGAEAKKLEDDILLSHVKAELYLSPTYRTSYNELYRWMADFNDHPQATDLYRLALRKMPQRKRVCSGKGKSRKCRYTGRQGNPPQLPLTVQKREQAQEAAKRARENEYDGMNPVRASARRKLLSQSWRHRSRGQYEQAFEVLRTPEARGLLNDTRWQSELLLVADAQLSRRNWDLMSRAAALASHAKGPKRDEALWLAGWGAYREGNRRQAVKYWRDLVENEPFDGLQTARGAWWAARAYEELGDRSAAREMLRLGARDTVAFYGILSARKLGQTVTYNWQQPKVNRAAAETLLRVKETRRAIALAQVGEIALSQMEVRLARDEIPPQVAETFAALALESHLPAISVQMARDILSREQRLVPAALYPLPDKWRAAGPRLIERSLLLAIMRQESAFHPGIGSHAGAQGLMQFMPATARYITNRTGRGDASIRGLHDPNNSMTLGQDYLAYLQAQTDGDLVAMLASYNGGLGNVRKWHQRGIAAPDDPMMFIESIPFDETRNYVQRVLGNLWIYQSRMGEQTWSLTRLAQNNWPRRYAALPPDERDIGG